MKFKYAIATVLFATIIFAGEIFALTGKYRGELSIGSTKLPLVINFNETPDGKTEATLDSPHQNATGLPLEVKYCAKDSLHLECNMIGAVYTGKIIGNKIEGNFMQRGFTLPLVLTPEEDITVRRPQTPQSPFPYIQKDTVFLSSDRTELAGTLTYPINYSGNPFPTVVMVTGSGPQNRDEEIFEHRPFAVLADYLARHGIGSFRYDDRGTGMSKGNYEKATIEIFKEDVKSAYKFTGSLPETAKTGILGHSEGGTLAILCGAEETPDFIITLAGMAVPAKETLLAQNIIALEQAGITGSQKEASIKLIDTVFNKIIAQYRSGNNELIDIDLISLEKSTDVPVMLLESIKRSLTLQNKYFFSMVSLDPTEALTKVMCPVLAMNGDKDLQVNADSNLEAFDRYVRNVEVKKMEGLNHLMQTAVTGDVSEYSEIKETISPKVLEIIADFIISVSEMMH